MGVEQLEGRTLLSLFQSSAEQSLILIAAEPLVVTTAADVGPGSLREAIAASNASAGVLDTITFAIDDGAQTIAPASPLPTITDPVVIDGTTQPGFVGSPLIELDGSDAGPGANGLRITAGNSTVRGLVIGRFAGDGIAVETGGGNRIEGNYIGTDPTGTADRGNGGNGVTIDNAPGNTIGGATTAARNVISSNRGHGIEIAGASATGNQVQGNTIGTDALAEQPLGNARNGVALHDAPGNVIGGTTFAARNVLSANRADGIEIRGAAASGNQVQGNFIGTDAFGTGDLGNGERGVEIRGAAGNTIGGFDFGARNVISGNEGNGVELAFGSSANFVLGNFIGTDVTGTTALGNSSEGVVVGGGAGNAVGGARFGAGNVISSNRGSGVVVSFGAVGTTVQGNSIGTDVTGTAVLGNANHGVVVAAANGNFIGGTPAGAGNLISGNGANGIILFGGAAGNQVQGNLIGTDVTATAVLGNSGQGVLISNAPGNVIGGALFGARNVISGNGANGLLLFGFSAAGNRVEGNLIGTQGDGTHPLGNASHGVLGSGGANNNTIGGAAGNTIAFNGGSGVITNSGRGNAIRANAIYANAGLAVDLGADGPSPNDEADGDAGANDLQNTPVLLRATRDGDGVRIQGRLRSTANATFTIEIFADSAGDPDGPGEGRTFLTALTVTTDVRGDASFFATVPGLPPGTHFLTATATDSAQNTSEFAHAVPVQTRNEAFVAQLYRVLLQREADFTGLAAWTDLLDQGAGRDQVVAGIQGSLEYRQVQVEGLYRAYLHRDADLPGLNGFTALLASGGTIEQVRSAILGSEEYFRLRGGGTVAGFVAALYQDVLGRAPDAPGAEGFARRLQDGLARDQVAQVMLSSVEADQVLVRALYDQVLARPVDREGLDGFVDGLQRGLREEQLVAVLAGSEEFDASL